MNTAHILSRSIATVLALTPLVTRAASDTLNGASWNTNSFWTGLTPAGPPGVNDNAIITIAGTVNVNPPLFTQKELQDMTFNSTAAVKLHNSSGSQDMTFTLNGGRGAGVPIISSVGDFLYTFEGQNLSLRKLNLQLKMGRASGDISVGANTGVNALVIDSIISETGGSQGINKTGAGRLILGGANTFTGGTTITTGVLEAKVNGALGTGAAIVNGGTLEINLAGATLTAASITINAGGQIATRNTTLNNAVTLSGGALAARGGDAGIFAGTVNVTSGSSVSLRDYTVPANSQSITISGLLTGNGALAINGADPETNGGNKALILTNSGNTYGGIFTVGSGQILRSAPTATGNTLGTGTVALGNSTLQLQDNGAGNNGTLSYGNNVTVSSGGGTVDVNRVSGANTGNTFQLGALSIGAQTLNVTGGNSYGVKFAGATTLTGDATFNPTTATATLGGAVGGGFGLTKIGAGNLVLGGTNTYSGQTNVDVGTLTLNGSLASSRIDVKSGATLNVTGAAGGFTLGGTQILSGTGSVTGTATIASGGTIQPGNASGTGTLTLGGLTFGAPANISITNNTTPATIAVTGANSLIANTGASVAINLPPVAPPIGTYVLIDYSGSIGGTAGFGAFHLGTLPNRLVANLVNNAGNTSIDLNVSGVDFPIWTGAQSSEWSTNTISPSKNWALNSNNATGTDFLTNDPVIFNDLATGTTVNVTVADVQPVSVTFNNTNNNFNITGTKAIIGATGITKSGAGRLTISNTNSFTGAVAVNGGTVSVASVANNGANSALGSGSSVTFNGGTLEYTGASGSTNRALTLNAGGGTLQTDNSLTLAGAIGGAGALTKTGAGTVILTGANGYGATVISSGALQVGDGGTTGTLGSGTITNNSDLVFNRSGANLVVGGAISGTGTVTNNGAGTAVLAGANSYGATVINSGTLQVGNGGATGTLGAGSVTNNGILAFNRSDTALVVTNAIDGTGSVRMNGVGTVTLGGPGSNSYSGGTTVSSGILVAGKAAGLQAIPGDLIISTGAAFRLGASDQIADGAVITINGGTFGDLASIAAPATGGPIDTVDTVIVNGGNFLSNRNLAGFTISTLLKVTAGTALVQRGGAVHVGAVEITGGAVSLDGGSTTGGNESRLNVGGGGILMTGGAINFNNGPSALTATSQGSKLLLTGNVTTVGTNSFARLNPIVPKAELDLGGVGRNFDVTGTLTIGVDVVNGDIVKEGPGKLVLNGLGSSYSTLTANAGRTDINESSPFASVTANAAVNFTVSQNLSDLTIGDGAVVTVGSPAPPAPPAFAEGIGFDETAGGLTESAAATVPEPCGTALLFGGLATLLGLRRNGRKRG